MSLKNVHIENVIEAGCDEAGRGCLAGPVCAAAVILPDNYHHPLINDSKQLSEKNRLIAREAILKDAIAYGIAFVDHLEIDKINILNASILAMHKALDELIVVPQHIIVDGHRFKPYKTVPHDCIIKGDGKYMSIAAASILAKTERDAFMKKLHAKHPQYNWIKNQGYPTKEHRFAIKEHGITPYHRRTYRLADDQMIINFPEE